MRAADLQLVPSSAGRASTSASRSRSYSVAETRISPYERPDGLTFARPDESNVLSAVNRATQNYWTTTLQPTIRAGQQAIANVAAHSGSGGICSGAG